MSGDWNPIMPTQSELTGLQGMQLMTMDDAQATVPLTLTTVYTGTPLNDGYLCYSATFQLPPNTTAAQGTYRLYYAQDKYWDLFLTPIKPTAEGIGRLEAVFHVTDKIQS